MTTGNKVKYGLVALGLVIVVVLAAVFSGGNFFQGALYKQSQLMDSQTQRYPSADTNNQIVSTYEVAPLEAEYTIEDTPQYTVENTLQAEYTIEETPQYDSDKPLQAEGNSIQDYGILEQYAVEPDVFVPTPGGAEITDVTLDKTTFDAGDGETLTVSYTLDNGTAFNSDVSVSVIRVVDEEDGIINMVKGKGYEDVGDGQYTYAWDGTDRYDNLVEAGMYRFVIRGETSDGEKIGAKSNQFMLTSAKLDNLGLNKTAFSPGAGETIALSYDLDTGDSSSAQVAVTVVEMDGNLAHKVKSWIYDAQTTGSYYEPIWDGTDQDGVASPVGDYFFNIHAVMANGEDVVAKSDLFQLTAAPVIPDSNQSQTPTPDPAPQPDPTPTPVPDQPVTPTPTPTPVVTTTTTTTVTTETTETTLMSEVATDFTESQETCAGFDDITINDKDCAAFVYVKSIGAMTGTDGDFNPSDLLQRDEIAKIILEMNVLYNKRTNYCLGSNPFPDVKSSDWSYQYICRAKDLGIVTGYEGGRDAGYYRPANHVNRAEFLAVVLRSLDEEIPTVNQFSYKDVIMGAWYVPYATYSRNNALFTGENLYPDQFVTRREVATVLYKLYQLGKI